MKENNVKVRYVTNAGDVFLTITKENNIIVFKDRFIFLSGYSNSDLKILSVKKTVKSGYKRFTNILVK